jgi:DUF917 family protein
MTLSLEDLEDLARGAAFLGTGGGGDPYAGRLMVRQALEAGGTVDIIDLQDVPDDALVIPTAMMGAPTVLVEKLPRGDEAVKSLRALERHLGQKAFATMPVECGGINSTMPLVVGARLGLPVVDADGMGRAFQSSRWRRSMFTVWREPRWRSPTNMAIAPLSPPTTTT